MRAKAGIWIAAGALLASLLAACAGSPKPGFEPGLSRSRELFRAGEYQAAIDTGADLLAGFPGEAAVKTAFIETLEGIHRQAGSAAAAQDDARAERLFALLLENAAKYGDLQGSLSFSPKSLARGRQICRDALAERRLAGRLEAGDFGPALADLKTRPPSEGGSGARAAVWTRTMREIKRRADAAAAVGDFGEAGRAYSALADHWEDAARLGVKPGFDRASALDGLKTCRTELTRRGLGLYRKGELARAIAVWQTILSFDPENQEIRKAVESARQQQKAVGRDRS